MAPVVVVAGYGPGISSAVAKKFAAEGFTLALVSRTQQKLDAAAAEFAAKGVTAKGYAADLAKPDEVQAVLAKVAAELGPVTVLFWNPPSTTFGDWRTFSAERIAENLSHQVTGLFTAIKEVEPGMVGQQGAGVLVTGGGLAMVEARPEMRPVVVQFGAAVVAAGKAGQHALVYTLAEDLKGKGIPVRMVIVHSVIKGSEFAANAGMEGSLDPAVVAEDFWKLYNDKEGPVVSERS